MSFDIAAQSAVQEVRRKTTQKVAAVNRVREVAEVQAETAGATEAAHAPAVFGPVYTFAQNMGLIQNRTLLIMQSRAIRDITRQGNLFSDEGVRKGFSNALVMVAAHSPEELEIFLLTTQRMVASGHTERLAVFFAQVTEALAERVRKKQEDDEEAGLEGEPPFPFPTEPDEDLVGQIRKTLEKRFAAARGRAAAMGVVPGEQPSEKLVSILQAGHKMVEDSEPAPETVLDLLTVKDK